MILTILMYSAHDVYQEINTIAYDVTHLLFVEHANEIPSHFVHEYKSIAHDVINVNVFHKQINEIHSCAKNL